MNRAQGVHAYIHCHTLHKSGGRRYLNTYAAPPTEIRSKVKVLGERGREESEDKGQDGDAESKTHGVSAEAASRWRS